MYQNVTKPEIRFSIGTDEIGLTYYLSRQRLKLLSSKYNESDNLKHNGPTQAKIDQTPAYCYRPDRSYLVWLQETSHNVFDQRIGDPLPLVERVHDWTLELDRFQAMLRHIHGRNTWEQLLEVSRSSLSLFPQLAAMSAASLVYGGLHLLAWNAPFHTPIHGLLWKISGIATASLGVILLLVLIVCLMIDFVQANHGRRVVWLVCFATALLFLELLCITLLFVFARVYLVVESFLSLAYLPDSALTTPIFSLYFPHIG